MLWEGAEFKYINGSMNLLCGVQRDRGQAKERGWPCRWQFFPPLLLYSPQHRESCRLPKAGPAASSLWGSLGCLLWYYEPGTFEEGGWLFCADFPGSS